MLIRGCVKTEVLGHVLTKDSETPKTVEWRSSLPDFFQVSAGAVLSFLIYCSVRRYANGLTLSCSEMLDVLVCKPIRCPIGWLIASMCAQMRYGLWLIVPRPALNHCSVLQGIVHCYLV